MYERSGFFKFFLFLFLAVIILLQFLSMLQADRLYKRLNVLVSRLESSPVTHARHVEKPADGKSSASGEYPGDQGDWLVQRIKGEPRTLNPISVEGSIEARNVYQRNIFETLFYYNLDYEGVKLEPVLAESMSTSGDGLEITIKLKENIWFSDGTPITADDVIFTYQTIQDPNIDAADIRNYYANFREVIKIDNKTVKFVLNEVYWKTIEAVGIFEVLPRHIYRYDNAAEFNSRRSNPVGSGPYIFEKWDVGQQIVLRSNPGYWGEKPKIDRLVFKIITNDTAALQALRSHKIDIMEPSSEQFAELSSDEKIKKEFHVFSYWEPSGGFSFIAWNFNTPYFNDRRVRMAMTHITNRQAIVDHLLKGYGKVITGPFYINGRQNNPDIEPWDYDIDKAKQLLGEAGWLDRDGDEIRDKDGRKFSFKYSYPSGSDTAERIAKLIKDDAEKAGIEVLPDPLEWSIFIERLNDRRFEAATLSWGGTIESDPYQIWHSSQIENRGSNFICYNNPHADMLIEQARRTLLPEKRYALYHEFHRLLHEEQPYTFLVSRPTFLLLDRRFENVKVHKLGVNSLEWFVTVDKQKYK